MDGRRVGQRIETLRKLRGWSQAELSRRSGVHRPTINLLERGLQNDLMLSVAMKLAHALGVDMNMLVGDDEPAEIAAAHA